MNAWLNKRNLWILVIVSSVAVFAYFDYWRNRSPVSAAVALLVPDEVPLNGHYVQLWTDAAQEEGIKLHPIHDSQWIHSVTRHENTWEGAILPDTFHRKMLPGLSIALTKYVQSGGKLMTVYDAGTLDQQGLYPLGQVELTPLVGFDYAMYNELGEGMSQVGAIVGGGRFFEEIGLPPGRYISRTISPQSGERLFDEDRNAASVQVVGYGKGLQRFSSMATKGKPNGQVLLRNELGSILVSRHQVGRGETFFINIPLTYLKQRTDSIFLHGFLRYFTRQYLQHPQLSEAPRGRGAVVLNWHVDAKPAVPAMKRLVDMGLFEREGPFSFHITAGPDVNTPGDAGGLDLDGNPEMKSLLKKLLSQGHTIASHGGWIHNYFGITANENNADDMIPLLEKNHDTLSRFVGFSPREYSAPQGNQPLWAHKWLEDHGVIASYLTGNVGMGPTRLWMGEKRIGNMWTFPVLTLGSVATAEDAFFQQVPQSTFENWLQEVARYVQEVRTVRLVYFHPPGAVLYPEAVTRFIDRMGVCRRANQCDWMTMTQAAEFMNQREQTQWDFQRITLGWQLSATHPHDLKDLTWRIPKQRFNQPELVRGEATVEEYPNEWLVIARSGKFLQLNLKEIQHDRIALHGHTP
jgi:hypothetical protein